MSQPAVNVLGLGFALLVGVTVTASSQIPATGTPGRPAFSVTADTVALSVAVASSSGYVGSLAPDDFVVLDNGRRQAVTVFAREEVPLDVLLLADTSASVSDRMALVRAAAKQLFRALRPEDRAAVARFDERLTMLAEWTSDQDALDRAIDGMTQGEQTALYNAIFVALRLVDGRDAGGAGWRRRAIVVISDGKDTASRISHEDVLDVGRRTRTLIYTVYLKGGARADISYRGVIRSAASEVSSYVLSSLAIETGARAFCVRVPDELPAVFAEIARELRTLYLVGYPAPAVHPDDPAFRKVQVLVPGVEGAQARTRRGYYASPGAPRVKPSSH